MRNLFHDSINSVRVILCSGERLRRSDVDVNLVGDGYLYPAEVVWDHIY